jgi:hypothetical protein
MARTSPKATPAATTVRVRDPKVWRAIRKPFRWRLLEAVRATGGMTAQDLARRAGISSQLMLYHLQLLEKAGLLTHDTGKRARGKGGKFRAGTARIDFAARPDDRTEGRKLESILLALDEEVRESRVPTEPVEDTVRWERLNADEVRRIRAALASIRDILSVAAGRRAGDTSVPDATHVVSMGIQAVRPGTLPSPAWSSSPGRRAGRRGR